MVLWGEERQYERGGWGVGVVGGRAEMVGGGERVVGEEVGTRAKGRGVV